MNELLKGVVTKSTGSWYIVRDENGNQFECRIRGKLRMDNIKSTNPVSVGDEVEFSDEGEGKGMISTVAPRRNYIVRKSVNLSRRIHIIAANIDQALLIVTLSQPVTSTGFIDRFAVAAESYKIPLAIVFNKVDLNGEKENARMEELQSIYSTIGYPCFAVSGFKKIGLDNLKDLMRDKVSLVAGHSGVGKSTLINAMEPGLQLRTQQISHQHQTGQHTTTNAEMHPLSFGGYIIDTPGIKGFGIIDIEKQELAMFFPEMRERLPDCKFYNCTHINEPKCAVKEAVVKGEISEARYNNYLSMFYDEQEEDYR